jgi:hypothetical protein
MTMSRAAFVRAGVLVLGGSALTALAPVSAATCMTWTGQQPPDVNGASVIVRGVATLSPCNAWLAGEVGSITPSQTLIYHWNGTGWKRVTTPSPGSQRNQLFGIAAVSASNIWAVGDTQDTGQQDQTLILHWNGTAWKRVTSPNPAGTTIYNDLYAVGATSAKDVWAVGEQGNGGGNSLILHWNGSSWSATKAPAVGVAGKEDYLAGVVGTSTGNAWAVGSYDAGTAYQTLIMHWNGTAWKHVSSPDPGSTSRLNALDAISATSSKNAWAVGADANAQSSKQTLILHWNGTAWKHVASPDPAGSGTTNQLNGVSAVSGSSAWAVGYDDNASAPRTLVLHWNGISWSTVRSPDQGTSATENELNAVSAESASDVWVAGIYYDTTSHALALHCC